jgi:hypothetical protein
MQAGWLACMLYSTAGEHVLRVVYQPEGRQKIKRFKVSTDRIERFVSSAFGMDRFNIKTA